MPVSKRLRYEVMRRDDHACRYCGGRAPEVELTIDHVQPISLGGADEAGNLVTACRDCNAGKSSSNPDAPLVDGVADDALKWAAAIKQAADIQAKDRARLKRISRRFLKEWSAHYIPEVQGDPTGMDLPHDWDLSVERLATGGLDRDDFSYAINATMAATAVPNHRLFRYCCGICWKRLDQRQEMARDILAAEDA